MVAPQGTDAETTAGTGEAGSVTVSSSGGGSSSTTTADTDADADGTAGTATAASTTTDDATDDATDGTTDDTTDDGSDSTGVPQPLNCAGFPGTIAYINFDGATLTSGAVDNAPAGITSEPVLAGEWPPYEEGDAEMIFALMQPHWEAFNICLALEPPDRLDYEMIVVQSQAYDDNDNILALTGPDCGNTSNNNVSVLFLATGLGLPEITKAIAISKHLAIQFGLDSVDDDSDLMNEFIGATLNGATFSNTCLPLVMGATCAGGLSCPGGQQNASEMLNELLGGP